MEQVPVRGRIIVVNFDMAGTATPPEMVGTRLALVMQNNKLERGRLVTVIPISATAPATPGKQHHRMSALSFQNLPIHWDRSIERWAKCDYVTTISLDRCSDPYIKLPYGGRKYVNVKAAKADTEAIETCVRWALGLTLTSASLL